MILSVAHLDRQSLGARPLDQLLRVPAANVSVARRPTNRIDRPDVGRSAPPIPAVLAGRVEVNRRELHRDDGWLYRGVVEDGAPCRRFDRAHAMAQTPAIAAGVAVC